MLRNNCANEQDFQYLWNALTKEHVIVTDINQWESNMLESANKLPQGLPESCVITNLINNEGINAATEATLNL